MAGVAVAYTATLAYASRHHVFSGRVAGFIRAMLPPSGRMAGSPPFGNLLMTNLDHGRRLAAACRRYASDHDGRLPVDLAELTPQYLTQKEWADSRYRVRVTGEMAWSAPSLSTDDRLEWLYFGTGFDETNPPPILIASPITAVMSGEGSAEEILGRVFVTREGGAKFDPEAKYQALLIETINQKGALTEQLRKPENSPGPHSP